TSGISHPENFIRARAVWLWHKKAADSIVEIRQMIEGHISIDELDIFRQEDLTNITKSMLRILIHPEWMRSSLILALAKQYFPELDPGDDIDTTELAGRI